MPADEATARAKEPDLARRAGEELADVLLYLVRLSDVLGIDLRAAADARLTAARGRFPAAEVRGTAPAPKGTAVPSL